MSRWGKAREAQPADAPRGETSRERILRQQAEREAAARQHRAEDAADPDGAAERHAERMGWRR